MSYCQSTKIIHNETSHRRHHILIPLNFLQKVLRLINTNTANNRAHSLIREMSDHKLWSIRRKPAISIKNRDYIASRFVYALINSRRLAPIHLINQNDLWMKLPEILDNFGSIISAAVIHHYNLL